MAETTKKLTEIKDQDYKQAFYLLLANIINNAHNVQEKYGAPGSKGNKAFEAKITVHITQKIIETAEEILTKIKATYPQETPPAETKGLGGSLGKIIIDEATIADEATIPREGEETPEAESK